MILKNRHKFGVVFLAAIISCFIAFLNNFPLVFQDTGGYIHSGVEGIVLYDRPIFYGLFIKYISFSSSLWYVVFAQGLLIAYLIYMTLGLFFEGEKRNYILIGSVAFLALCTAFSHVTSILIPDIFTSISVLCVLNLILNKKLKVIELAFLSFVFVLSICVQFSSIASIAMLLGVCLLYFLYNRIKRKSINISFKRWLLSSILFSSCLLLIPTVHYSFDRQFKISGSNHVFIMNHFVETGILAEYLAEACDSHNYKICEFKKDLGWDFIWSSESPVQKTGGWEANRVEYKAIIKDIITTPKYFWMTVQKGIEFSFKQFFTFQILNSPPQLSSTSSFEQIEWRYKPSAREYISSLQSQNKLNSDATNVIQQFVILISMAFLLVLFLSPGLWTKLSFELKFAVIIIIAHNIINSVICSNLSTVHPRFQNRIAWLLPLCVIIIVLKLIEIRKNQQKNVPGNLN